MLIDPCYTEMLADPVGAMRPPQSSMLEPMAAVSLADLHGLPMTTLLTAEYDPLCDEGQASASPLRRQGTQVFSRRYLGMGHRFFSMPDRSPMAGRAITDIALDMKYAFKF